MGFAQDNSRVWLVKKFKGGQVKGDHSQVMYS